MTPPLDAEVVEVLDELLPMVRDQLGEELVGIWLWGSATLGGYRPGRSDVDLLVGLAHDPDERMVERLRTPHEALVELLPQWRDRIEAAYVGLDSLASFRDREHPIVRISPGEPINLRSADRAWLVDWWQARTHGVTLDGPPPAEALPAIEVDELREHLRSGMQQWADVDPAGWRPSYASYVVLGIARALRAIATGRQASKQDAGSWLVHAHPEWAPLAVAAVEAHVGEGAGPELSDTVLLRTYLTWAVGRSTTNSVRD